MRRVTEDTAGRAERWFIRFMALMLLCIVAGAALSLLAYWHAL